jgi:hypothetical protein
MKFPVIPDGYNPPSGTKIGARRVMGKSLDWVREEPTGRLIFRRAYPEAVRPFLVKPGQRELKVPLGARRIMTMAAMRTYEAAKRRFDEDVERAQCGASDPSEAGGRNIR